MHLEIVLERSEIAGTRLSIVHDRELEAPFK
jgi:hypothetical protein